MNVCICLISFNRPNYLKQTLEALAKNTVQLDTYLVQDGAVNKFSGRQCCLEDDIYKCVDHFYNFFPHGVSLASNQNVGMALQYDRAEEWCFKFNNYEAVIFIEDDFVPGPQYIEILLEIYKKTKNIKEIGTITAYGPDRFMMKEEQVVNEFSLEIATPSWGYLLSRNRWKERQPFYQSYLDLVKNVDYRERPQEDIIRWLKGNRFNMECSSQDAAHSVAMVLAGQVKLGTSTRNAYYIGRDGIHMDPIEFDNGYYGKDHMWKYNSLDFIVPSQEWLGEQLRTIRKAARV